MKISSPPPETSLGAILGHITGGANAETFQPMNVNFGLFPPLEKAYTLTPNGKKKKLKGLDRKKAYTSRALAVLPAWLSQFEKVKAA